MLILAIVYYLTINLFQFSSNNINYFNELSSGIRARNFEFGS
jgi:hypothetical protein